MTASDHPFESSHSPSSSILLESCALSTELTATWLPSSHTSIARLTTPESDQALKGLSSSAPPLPPPSSLPFSSEPPSGSSSSAAARPRAAVYSAAIGARSEGQEPIVEAEAEDEGIIERDEVRLIARIAALIAEIAQRFLLVEEQEQAFGLGRQRLA